MTAPSARNESAKCWTASTSRCGSTNAPVQLSGGQQQRVPWLARWCVGPVFSCSTNRFPHSTLRCVRNCAADSSLLAECDIPVFLVTHDRAEALALGDELVVMSGGAMRQSGPVLEVFNRPADAEVARSCASKRSNRAAS